jgi:hypothetical protein
MCERTCAFTPDAETPRWVLMFGRLDLRAFDERFAMNDRCKSS